MRSLLLAMAVAAVTFRPPICGAVKVAIWADWRMKKKEQQAKRKHMQKLTHKMR